MFFLALYSILNVLVTAWATGSLTREEPTRSPNTWNGVRPADSKREDRATVKPAKNFDPENDAARLYKAMKGVGTNEDELIKVLAYRSLEQRKIISKSFTKKYKYNFENWLFGEISGWFKSTIQGMMNPDHMLARDLRWATKGRVTDVATLIVILVPITREELERVKDYYQSQYKTSLWYHIQDEIQDNTEPFQKLIKLLLNGRPSSWAGGKKIELNRETAKNSAKSMYNNGSIFDRSNEDRLHQILTQTPREQLKLTLEEFHSLTGKSFVDVVVEENREDWYSFALQSIALWASNPERYFTICLNWGMTTFEFSSGDYVKMDERILRRIVVWRSEIDLNAIKQIVQKLGYDIEDFCYDREQYFRETLKALCRS